MNEVETSRYGWQVVALLWFAFALSYVDRQMSYSIFPVLRAQLGFTERDLGLVGGIFGCVYAICMPLTGRLADFVRRDRLVISSLVLWSFATFATGLCHHPFSFLALRAVMGVTEALYFPAAVGLIADLHSGSTRSKALGIHQAAQLVGIVIGGWYGGWTAEHMGWRHGYWIMAIAGLVYAAFLAKALRGAALPRARHSDRHTVPFFIFRSKSYMALSLAFFAFCGMLWIVYAWLPDFLHQKYNLSLAASGFTATIYIQTSSGIGILIGGVLADWLAQSVRTARFLICSVGIFVSAPLAYLIFETSSIHVMEVAATAFGLFAGLMIGNLFAAVYDIVPRQYYGSGSGVMNMIGGLSGAATMTTIGVLKTSFGIPELVLYAAIATAFTALVLAAAVTRNFAADHQKSLALSQ